MSCTELICSTVAVFSMKRKIENVKKKHAFPSFLYVFYRLCHQVLHSQK
uniref:Uncharacterized protein n=1 Tax=Rhizophora mucronata TaxID=61149 RepID=A0A2P2NN84_RHIMU